MSQLSPIQEKLLDLLKWFHGYCEEQGLTYYAIGGTLLGACRHNGFIPWDDDIDLGMPREDYERFISLTQGKQFGSYVTETYRDGNPDFTYSFLKIYDVNTTLVERRRLLVKRGLYLDIYPIDGIGSTLEEGKAAYSEIGRRLNMISCKVSAIRKGRSWYKNAAVLAWKLVPGFLFSVPKQLEATDRLCRERGFANTAWVGNLYGLKREGEIVPHEYFGTPVLYSFEDMKVLGPARADAYLTHIYKDWRKLPPKEKQATHHDYVSCDLERGYQS